MAHTAATWYGRSMPRHSPLLAALSFVPLLLACTSQRESAGAAPSGEASLTDAAGSAASGSSAAMATTDANAAGPVREAGPANSSAAWTGADADAAAQLDAATTSGAADAALDSGKPASSAVPTASSPLINTECAIAANATLSEDIATVGIVTFTTDLGTLTNGYVEFGLDTNYGMRAPLDVGSAGYRTLLLGMKPSSDYHYRIVAQAGDAACRGADAVLTTGPVPAGVPRPEVVTPLPEQVAPGFTVTSSGTFILIFDKDGDPVWWHGTTIGGVTRARISWDGKFIYGRDGNPAANGAGRVVRVSMDGAEEEAVAVPTGHHDMTSIPGNGLLFLTGGGGDGCSMVRKLSESGELTDVYDARQAFGDAFKAGNDPCHCNSIHYNPDDDTITFSCLSQNAYVKITSDGQLVWVLGGNNGQSQFTGDDTWARQHGHHMIAPDRILFFNNNGLEGTGSTGGMGGIGASAGSLAVELLLDLDAMTATRVWTYDGDNASQTLGDVQRLENGNTLVTYSNAGVQREVNADQETVRDWTFSAGTGYANHRLTLYGAPPFP